METTMELKELHDELLARKPSGAAHDTENCPMCADQSDGTSSPATGGDMSKTFTQDELDAAVAEAVKGIQAELETIKAQATQSEVEARLAEAEDSVKELQSQLDAAVLETQAAKQEKEELLSWLESEKQAAEAAAELAARRDERLAKVAEVASFPEEYMQANADRWAGMPDDDFEAAINDWKTIGAKKESGDSTTPPPRQTAMVASRDDSGDVSVLKDVLNLRFTGVDPRRV